MKIAKLRTVQAGVLKVGDKLLIADEDGYTCKPVTRITPSREPYPVSAKQTPAMLMTITVKVNVLHVNSVETINKRFRVLPTAELFIQPTK